jgi:hypothetical protein
VKVSDIRFNDRNTRIVYTIGLGGVLVFLYRERNAKTFPPKSR